MKTNTPILTFFRALAARGTLALVLFLQVAPLTLAVLVASSTTAQAQSYPAWAPNTSYAVGARVTYAGSIYRCLQAHTSITSWEPPNTPALWSLEGGTPTPTAPAVPSGLAASANGTTAITVTWTSVSGATGYDLQRDGVTVTNVTSPHQHTGLAANSSHTYAVRAKNSAGTSAWSAAVTARTQSTPTAPPVPTGLSATANSQTQITVNWNVASGASSYDLQVDGAIVSNATRPYVHSGLASNSTHTYAVRARNSSGASAFSSSVQATTSSTPTAPGVPGGLSATVDSTSQITVRWNSVSGATGYDLQRDGATVASVTSPYAHTGLAAGSNHTYAVRAKNSAGTSAWSASVSAQTNSSNPGGGLTLGQVANPNGRYFTGYYPSWSDNWFTVTNWDGTKKSDNEIYQASQFARIPGIYTHVLISFGQPDFAWNGLSANNWSGTGINFNGTPVDIKESIRLLHILKKKVILAVGGATYNNWAGLANEAGRSGPIKSALTRFMVDMGVDGLDVDYEIIAADAATVTEYAKAIQAMREAVDAAGGGRLLTVAGWSTGADYTADLAGEPGYPGRPSYWGGGAGRERKVFKRTVPNGPHAGRSIVSLFDVVNIMAYDAQTNYFDPVTAFDQYRAIVPSSIPVGLGLEIPPEGWAGGVLVINNNQAGAPGTIVVRDQYERSPRGPYSVERSIGHVIANSRNSHDGAMLWQILKTQSVQAGSHPSANATTVEQKLSSMFNYVPRSP